MEENAGAAEQWRGGDAGAAEETTNDKRMEGGTPQEKKKGTQSLFFPWVETLAPFTCCHEARQQHQEHHHHHRRLCWTHAQIFSMLSHEPVQSAIPFGLASRHETRFVWPWSVTTRSPLSVSHTLQLKSS